MKIYAVKLNGLYVTDLFPLAISEDFSQAKTYNKLGPARSLKTKLSKQLIKEFNEYAIKAYYFNFPKIEVFDLVSKGYTK